MQTSDRKNKFSIQELVEIGDALHNSETSIVLVDKGEIKDEKRHEILGAIRGKHKNLVTLLISIIEQDQVLFQLFNEALMRYNLDKLKKSMER